MVVNSCSTPAQVLGSNGQAAALVVAKTQPLAPGLPAQHAILFLKIVDDVLVPLVQPASQGN
jgi:hypothetical protein